MIIETFREHFFRISIFGRKHVCCFPYSINFVPSNANFLLRRKLHRHLSRFKWKCWRKNREEFLTAGYVVFEKSCPWVGQNQNIVKARLAFPAINRNAKILSERLERFNDRFSGYWMYWLFMNFDCWEAFLNNRARESRFIISVVCWS